MSYRPPELDQPKPTPEELAQRHPDLVKFLTGFAHLLSGEIADCPHCGTRIDKMRQVGRCVYGDPCGCRLYQGKIPKGWKNR